MLQPSYLLPIGFRAGRGTEQHFGQRLVQQSWGGGRWCTWRWVTPGLSGPERKCELQGPFFSYITVLFSRERLSSSQAGSTVTRVFDVGLNSSSYVPFIFASQPPRSFSNHQRLICSGAEIFMSIHPSSLLSLSLFLLSSL